MPVTEISFAVGAEAAGRTLAAELHRGGGISHANAKGLVAGGHARVNGRVVRDIAHRLAAGDRVEARYDPATRYHAPGRRREPSGFRVVLEDDDLLVVDKEAGLLAVPAPSRAGGTLADRVLLRDAARGRRAPAVWIVHRIDRFTSGLMLFARKQAAAARLIEQFEKRLARREYLAICRGVPDPPRRRLESWLVEDPRTLKVAAVRRRAGAARAVCSYVVEEELEGAALLRVTLETGRRNQIRVQLAAIGHPILGDRAYGEKSPLIPRAALHAARLGFRHPRTGAPVSVESPLPGDMRRLLRRLRRARTPDRGPRRGLTDG